MRVGRVTRILEDKNRKETLTLSKENRKICISFFYPIDNEWKENRQALYTDLYSPKEADFINSYNDFVLAENDNDKKKHLETIKTNIYDNAPISKTNNKYPVIIQVTGLGAPRDCMTFNIERLVNEGYVVFTIGHFYDSKLNVLPNGEIVNPPHNDLTQDDKMKIIDIRSKDILFLLNNLEELNKKEIMKDKLDLNQIGVIGHSVGGASVFKASQSTSKIKATVLLDASLQFFNLNDQLKEKKKLNTPTLNFRRGEFDYGTAMKMFIDHIKLDEGKEFKQKLLILDKVLRDSSFEQKNLYNYLSGYKSFVKLHGSNHMTFSDFPIIINKKVESKSLSVNHAHEIINDLTIRFLDEFLCEKQGSYSKYIKDNEYITIFNEDRSA